MEDRPNKRKRDSERVITEVEKKDATLFIKTLQRRINMFTPKVPKLVELNRKDDPSFEGKAIDPTAPADHHWAAHTSFILDGVQRTFLADTWFHSRLEAKVTVARLVDEFLDDYDKVYNTRCLFILRVLLTFWISGIAKEEPCSREHRMAGQTPKDSASCKYTPSSVYKKMVLDADLICSCHQCILQRAGRG